VVIAYMVVVVTLSRGPFEPSLAVRLMISLTVFEDSQ
jgi:hypothetical protein